MEFNLENYIFNEELDELDSEIDLLINLEEERQNRKIILIASESIAPKAVRKVLSSTFTHIYAEGYPAVRMIKEESEKLNDFSRQLAYQRRYGDARFYKGCDYVNFIEAIAIKRIKNLFATDNDPENPFKIRPSEIFANVQPLSGAAANNAVYEAFLKPGDTVMGMELTHGGHLTHGSPLNRSGKRYNIISYSVPKNKDKIDYEQIQELAFIHKPKMIIAGYSAYPWSVDWSKFREIADSIGAILLADVSHTVGLIVAKEYPNPLGYAHVISFTTHKTLCGPRGAVILTTDPQKAAMIDNAVFPGEQGGPHINNIAAKAVAFAIAKTKKFKELQRKVKENIQHLANAFKELGIKLAYGGSDTHLLLIDLKSLKTPYKTPLSGEIASRILDLCGITCNKNTLPGDLIAGHPSGLRFGTTWVTQRGMGKPEMEKIAYLIHKIITNIHPFTYIGNTGIMGRGKIELDIMEEVKKEVIELESKTIRENKNLKLNSVYPFYQDPINDCSSLIKISGNRDRVKSFLQEVTTSNLLSLKPGESKQTFVLDKDSNIIDNITVTCLEDKIYENQASFLVQLNTKNPKVITWFRALSDGYVIFDKDDVLAKVEGPVIVTEIEPSTIQDININIKENLPNYSKEKVSAKDLLNNDRYNEFFDLNKPYFVGQKNLINFKNYKKKKEFEYKEEIKSLKKSCLYKEHVKLTKKIIPFAGWEMPLWYKSISEEHRAVRNNAALFDVSHMGVLEVKGEHATQFLNIVTANYVSWLYPGQSQYSYVLDPDGIPMDDILVYRLKPEHYMIIVNAVNADKILDWFNAVNSKEYIIDRQYPYKEIEQSVSIRNLKDKECGDDQKVDIALQGPKSLDILKSIISDKSIQRALSNLQKFEFLDIEISGIPTIVSRTGYTGESIGFEFYLHPDNAVLLWRLLLEKGADFGIVPAGLGSRDSTRTEAGLPLYGHELAGNFNITPMGAGYGSFVKFHKPYFIGRDSLLKLEEKREFEIIRFRMENKAIKMVHPGDIVVNNRGQFIGNVTSCVLVEGIQIGLAYVDRKFIQVGTKINIFTIPHDGKPFVEKSKLDLKLGDKVLLHEPAIILPRFWTSDKSIKSFSLCED